MKTFKFKTSLLATVAFCLFLTSCSQNEDKSTSVNGIDVTQKSDSAQDLFLRDPRLKELDNSLAKLKELEYGTQGFYDQYVVVHNLAYGLANQFGQPKIIGYIDTQINETEVSGGCCSLTAKGTTDWSCCSFWETAKVLFKSIGCQQPSGIDPESIQQQAKEYYECVQSVICETC